MNTFEEKVFEFDISSDLQLYYCGRRIQSYSHRFGPYHQNRYIINVVTEGEATLHTNEKSFILKKNDLYVIFPNSGVYYTSNKNLPWSIKWFVATGSQIERYLALLKITPEKPYIELHSSFEVESVLDELFEKFNSYLLHNKIYSISLIHKFFSLLANNNKFSTCKNKRIQLAIEYIAKHYTDDLSVSNLSASLGYNNNYFTKLFKSETGYTPYEFINFYRFDSACKMLEYTDKSINEIALETGFLNPLYFSRAFKKHKKVSPSQYRKQLTLS